MFRVSANTRVCRTCGIAKHIDDFYATALSCKECKIAGATSNRRKNKKQFLKASFPFLTDAEVDILSACRINDTTRSIRWGIIAGLVHHTDWIFQATFSPSNPVLNVVDFYDSNTNMAISVEQFKDWKRASELLLFKQLYPSIKRLGVVLYGDSSFYDVGEIKNVLRCASIEVLNEDLPIRLELGQ